MTERPSPTESHYIYLIRPRPGFVDSMTPGEEAVMAEHFAYLQDLMTQGRLVMAGPCLDGAFGIVILRVPSQRDSDGLEEARGLMEADPAVRAGVMRAELHPFKISLS